MLILPISASPCVARRFSSHRGAAGGNAQRGKEDESQRRRGLHPRGGAPLPRPAGPHIGPPGLCREDDRGGRRRRHAGISRRDDEELGPDERGGNKHVERDARGHEAEGVTARDTIFALSSGSPPAAVALVRISGPAADDALLSLTR